MTGGGDRPAILGGLWTFLGGAAAFATLLVALDPIMRKEDCPNHGANGNASAFANPEWDHWLPLALLGWIVLVTLEQALPIARRHRERWIANTRSALIVLLSIICSCCTSTPLLIMCH